MKMNINDIQVFYLLTRVLQKKTPRHEHFHQVKCHL